MSKAILIVGVAGSGKTWTAYTLYEWFASEKQDVVVLNLDPGVDNVPYTPVFDIRDYVDLWRVMNEYRLGPNGGLIVSMDLMLNHLEKINSVLRSIGNSLAIIDTPGQLEVFLYRPSGKLIIDSLDVEELVIIYIVDAVFVKDIRNLVASMMLGGTLKLKFQKPLITILNKIDLIDKEELNTILKLSKKPILLKKYADKYLDTFESDFIYHISRLMRRYGVFTEMVPVSSLYMTNYESLIGLLTRILFGGEEYYSI